MLVIVRHLPDPCLFEEWYLILVDKKTFSDRIRFDLTYLDCIPDGLRCDTALLSNLRHSPPIF
jgi:hypothetical protein